MVVSSPRKLKYSLASSACKDRATAAASASLFCACARAAAAALRSRPNKSISQFRFSVARKSFDVTGTLPTRFPSGAVPELRARGGNAQAEGRKLVGDVLARDGARLLEARHRRLQVGVGCVESCFQIVELRIREYLPPRTAPFDIGRLSRRPIARFFVATDLLGDGRLVRRSKRACAQQARGQAP